VNEGSFFPTSSPTFIVGDVLDDRYSKRKTYPIPIASKVFPVLLCTNCKVLGLILSSLCLFETLENFGIFSLFLVL
jgi:hypothetical protein